MTEARQIQQIAKNLLCVRKPCGTLEQWLWDRACRIARHAEEICKITEIIESKVSIDRTCLEAAALFSDVGLFAYADAKGTKHSMAVLELSRPELRSFSAQILQEKLTSHYPKARLDRICQIIQESDNRYTQLPEARILSDARNLEDLGAIGVIQDLRRCMIQGKGISAALKSWKQKVDYRYWDARLKEGFHFESIRQLAEKRYLSAEEIMIQVQNEHNASDFKGLELESLNHSM